VDAASLVRRARTEAGLTQRELADRAGTSQPAVAAVEAGRKQPTVATLSRWLEAAGAGIALDSAADRQLRRRGEELVAVLRLAQALPYRPSRSLRFPRIPS
jgi:transcriptional regulator with XRE-family HTH domain